MEVIRKTLHAWKGRRDGMQIFILTLIIFGLYVLGMSLGVIFSDKCIQGSCGGVNRLKQLLGGSPCESCPLKEQHLSADDQKRSR